MGVEKILATNECWAEFVAASGTIDVEHMVMAFGELAKLADELVELVLYESLRVAK